MNFFWLHINEVYSFYYIDINHSLTKMKINSYVTDKSHISNAVMLNKSQKAQFFGVIFFALADKVISKTTNKFALESIFFRSL